MTETPAQSVTALARKVAASWGMPAAADMVQVRMDGGMLHVDLGSTQMGRTLSSMRVEDDFVDDIENDGPLAQDLRTRLSEMIRLEMRAAAMPDHDLKRPPAWSVSMPRLFADMLSLNGKCPQDVIDDLPVYAGWEEVRIGPDGQCDVSAMMVSSGRLLGKIMLSGGTSDVTIRSCDDEDGACTVIVHDMDLPETAISAICGRTLEDVIAHDMLDASAGHVVRQAVRRLAEGRREVHLHLEPDHVWGGPSPSGCDVSWREVREGRRLPIA